MSFNYTKARATAKKIITKYGAANSLVKKGNTSGKDKDGDPIADTPDISIAGIITPLVQYKTSELDGDSIISGDAWAFFYTESIVPIEIDMQATVNGKTFSIKGIKRLSSVDDINVYTRLNLRK